MEDGMAPTPVFLPGESQGQRSLADYSPMGSKRVRHDWCYWASTHERRLMKCKENRVLVSARRSNQSILKEISAEYSLEGLILKLKLLYFGHLMQRTNSLEKYTDAGKDWRREETETTEGEMAGWYHWLDGHEFEQALGVVEIQGSLACCSPGGCKESDTTKELSWTDIWWGGVS